MKIATRTFTATYGGERIVIEEGERVDDSHDVVARFPGNFRRRELSEELAIRSRRVQQLRTEPEYQAGYRGGAKSEAGRRAQAEASFWDKMEQLITPPDPLSPAERGLAEHCERGLAELDAIDRGRDHDVLDQAARDFGWDAPWSRRR